MFKIMENTAHSIITESNLATVEAANRRIKMLRKRFPHNEYWVDSVKPAVTVTRILDNDPTAIHLVRK
jgi:hypothetical protein